MKGSGLPGEKDIAQPRPLWRRLLRTAVVTTAVAYAAILLVAMIFEEKLIYFPSRDAVGPSPGEEVWLTAADGVRLHGWYLARPGAKAAILHLHGNAGNLEDRRGLVRELGALGVNVLAIDFRGYGKSLGQPSEKGLYADARAAYDWLALRVPPDRIVIHGESLGGGPACELAGAVPCGGLILQSAFTSARDMAPLVMPLFPKWLVRTRYDNLGKVARIPCRKLFIHCRNDEIVPFEMGTRLFAAASLPKECEWYDRGGHNELSVSLPREYYPRLARFLEPYGK